jgi:hypothetical protein
VLHGHASARRIQHGVSRLMPCLVTSSWPWLLLGSALNCPAMDPSRLARASWLLVPEFCWTLSRWDVVNIRSSEFKRACKPNAGRSWPACAPDRAPRRSPRASEGPLSAHSRTSISPRPPPVVRSARCVRRCRPTCVTQSGGYESRRRLSCRG